MHSVHVSSQLLVSGLFIAVPTNAQNFKIFLYLFLYFFNLCNRIAICTHNRKHAVFIYTGRIIAWLCDGGLTA